MNGKDLMMGLCFVEERYIQESEVGRLPLPWKRWVPVAACLGLLLSGFMLFGPRQENQVRDEISNENITGGPGEAIQSPSGGDDAFREESQVTEAPTVIVHIDAWTDEGFIATVVEIVDTEVYPVGTELSVRVDRTDPEEETKDAVLRWQTGDVVYLIFTPEDLESGIVNADRIWKEEE